MIIIMKRKATAEEISDVVANIEASASRRISPAAKNARSSA